VCLRSEVPAADQTAVTVEPAGGASAPVAESMR
jgi:hypothetical protein